MMMFEYRDLLNDCSKKLKLKYNDYKQNAQYCQMLNWNEIFNALISLQELEIFKKDFGNVISQGLQFNNDNNNPTIQKDKLHNLKNEIDYIRKKCEGIVDFIDKVYGDFDYDGAYIFLRVPDEIEFENLSEISKSLNLIFTQCPLAKECEKAKIIGVEKGSNFFTVLLDAIKEPAKITAIMIAFGKMLKLFAEAYKKYGEGYLAIQKGKTEIANKENLKKRAQEKNIKLTDEILIFLEKDQKCSFEEDLRDFVVNKAKEILNEDDVALEPEDEGRLLLAVKEYFKVTKQGVQFIPNKRIDESIIGIFPEKDDYPAVGDDDTKLIEHNKKTKR